MNAKITFPELVAELSLRSGQSKRICEDFLKELFATISSTLADGESVKIRHLGTFKVVEVSARKSVNVRTGESFEISGHRKVTFTPDRELADAVNSPFDAFQTVELDDNVTEEMLNSVDESSAIAETPRDPDPDFIPLPEPPEFIPNLIPQPPAPPVIEKPAVPEPAPASEQTAIEEVVTPPEPEPIAAPEPEPIVESEPEPVVEPEPIAEQTVEFQPEEAEIVEPAANPRHSKRRFARGYLWGILSCILLIAAAIGIWGLVAPDNLRATWSAITTTKQAPKALPDDDGIPATIVDTTTDDTTIDTLTIQQTEMTAEQKAIAPTQPSDQPVYDTIGQKRYLTTMAKEHYGSPELWPYIYEENKAILGHPDRIKPGTKVVIPPASKYNIDANNPECIAKAKRLGTQIYSRYQ